MSFSKNFQSLKLLSINAFLLLFVAACSGDKPSASTNNNSDTSVASTESSPVDDDTVTEPVIGVTTGPTRREVPPAPENSVAWPATSQNFSVQGTSVPSLGSISEKQLIVTPTIVRVNALRSPNVMAGLNRVQQAKSQLRIAQLGLLPRVDITIFLGAANPAFALQSINYMVPFLIPSNWFAAAQQGNLYDAEKLAYQTLRLDLTASALSIYSQLIGAIRLREILSEDVSDLSEIRRIVEMAYGAGIASREDLERSRSAALIAQARLDNSDALVAENVAALRRALAIDLDYHLIIDPQAIPASNYETISLNEIVENSLSKAPERAQLESLVKAAEKGKWAQIFGFITGASLSSFGFGGENTSLAFRDFQRRINAGIGFDYFAQIGLSNLQIEAVKIRQQELLVEFRSLAESNRRRLDESRERLRFAQSASESASEVFRIVSQGYLSGREPLQNVVITRRELRESRNEVVAAKTDVDVLRINLHRLGQTSEFARIRGCVDMTPGIRESLKKNKGSAAPKSPEGLPYCAPYMMPSMPQ
jgi:outer membrane protein TolC